MHAVLAACTTRVSTQNTACLPGLPWRRGNLEAQVGAGSLACVCTTSTPTTAGRCGWHTCSRAQASVGGTAHSHSDARLAQKRARCAIHRVHMCPGVTRAHVSTCTATRMPSLLRSGGLYRHASVGMAWAHSAQVGGREVCTLRQARQRTLINTASPSSLRTACGVHEAHRWHLTHRRGCVGTHRPPPGQAPARPMPRTDRRPPRAQETMSARRCRTPPPTQVR